jgi:hypothetical protein
MIDSPRFNEAMKTAAMFVDGFKHRCNYKIRITTLCRKVSYSLKRSYLSPRPVVREPKIVREEAF